MEWAAPIVFLRLRLSTSTFLPTFILRFAARNAEFAKIRLDWLWSLSFHISGRIKSFGKGIVPRANLIFGSSAGNSSVATIHIMS